MSPTPHFGNARHLWALPSIKCKAMVIKVIMNLNIEFMKLKRRVLMLIP
jgi:hypothetical protein